MKRVMQPSSWQAYDGSQYQSLHVFFFFYQKGFCTLFLCFKNYFTFSLKKEFITSSFGDFGALKSFQQRGKFVYRFCFEVWGVDDIVERSLNFFFFSFFLVTSELEIPIKHLILKYPNNSSSSFFQT